jgi:peptidoglycan/LPS O-acetylase OafA/YrhL
VPGAEPTTYVSAGARPDSGPADRTPGQGHDGVGGGFRSDVEGLRAVAVGLVVLYHAGLVAVSGGYVGVDIFFVISGFVITTTLAREVERRGTISIAGFYARRATRLLPAATAVILVTLVASWLWLPPVLFGGIATDALASTLYAVNYRLANVGIDYFATQTPSPLQHYWSLAVEEQFYLVWPLLLIALAFLARGRSRGERRTVGHAWTVLALVAIIAVSFTACVAITRRSLPWAYFGAPTRAWELALGALVAVGARRLARIPAPLAAVLMWTGVAAIAGSALGFDDATVFPGYAAALPVAGAALVIAGGCASPRGGAHVLLGAGPFQLIGKVSYSWYLWHWPVLMIAPSVLHAEPALWQRLLLAAVSLVLAAVCFTVLEDPIRRAKSLRAVPWKGISVGASLSAGTVAASLVAGLLVPPAVGSGRDGEDLAATIEREAGLADASGGAQLGADAAQQGAQSTLTAAGAKAAERRLTEAVAAGAALGPAPSNLTPTLDKAPEDVSHIYHDKCDPGYLLIEVDPPCQYGDPGSATTIVLFGDSHAGQWSPAVEAIATRHRWRLMVFTKSACSAASVLTYVKRLHRTYTECKEWRERTIARIQAMRPTVVVLASLLSGVQVERGDTDQIWTQGWLTTMRRLKAEGRRLVFINDTPSPKGNIPECVSANLDDVKACDNPVTAALQGPALRRMIPEAAAREGAVVVDPTAWFCTADTCPAIVGNVLVYHDNSHIGKTYAAVLSPLLEARIVPASR